MVGAAFEGEVGVEQMDELKPDLVLLDLELPGIDGIEVTKRREAARARRSRC